MFCNNIINTLLIIRIQLLSLLALADCRKHIHVTVPANVTRFHDERINFCCLSVLDNTETLTLHFVFLDFVDIIF